jgi:glycosyltransferase involved in cell wall biosynthesis
MKVLVLSYNFGRTSSGKTTSRIIDQLHKMDIEIKVICANNFENQKQYEVITVNPKPIKPARLFNLLGNLIGKELNYIFWEKRSENYAVKLIKNYKPDIIYSRGSPISAMTVGAKLSKKLKIPLITHFADPIPATEEWLSNNKKRLKLLATIKPIIKYTKAISFVTEQMYNYQLSLVKDLACKDVFISPNIISAHKSILENRNPNLIFLFLGSFTKERNPNLILNEFMNFCEINPKAEFHIYGNGIHTAHIDSKFKKCDNIFFHSEIKDIDKVINSVDILVDVDTEIENQVFLSGKMMEYLSHNKIILSITTLNSPAYDLLKKLNNTSVLTNHKKENIYNSFIECKKLKEQRLSYRERNLIRDKFSETNICLELKKKIKEIINEN